MRERKAGNIFLAVFAPVLYLAIQYFVAQGVLTAAAVFFTIQSGTEGISEVPSLLQSFLDTYGMGLVIASQLAGLAVFGGWFYRSVLRNSIGTDWRPPFYGRNIAGLMLLAMGIYLGVFLYLNLLELISPDMMDVYNGFMEDAGISDLSLLSTAAAVVLAPLVEELIFRGISFHYLKKAGAGFWLANIIQAALFAFVHLQLVQGSYAFILGLILGCLLRRFQTITAPILFHCFFNFFGTYLAELLDRFEVTGWLMLLAFAGFVAAAASGMKLLKLCFVRKS